MPNVHETGHKPNVHETGQKPNIRETGQELRAALDRIVQAPNPQALQQAVNDAKQKVDEILAQAEPNQEK